MRRMNKNLSTVEFVALAAALLLGAGYGYLQWISTTQAPAFAGDPVEYGFADTPDIPAARVSPPVCDTAPNGG